MKILGLIPARGGSKGIPNKNRKMLCGKPLMQYTIETALASKKLDRVIFSSEDDTLIALAKQFGVEVPFKRPSKYSLDSSPSIDFVTHALQALLIENERYDAVCLLQVTNPFRTAKDIDNAIALFEKTDTDSLVSVLKVPHEYNPHWVYKADNKGRLLPIMGETEIIKRRQDLPETYIRDGSIYLTKTQVIIEENSLYGKSMVYIESNPATHINIDTMEDWAKAEIIAEKLKNEK